MGISDDIKPKHRHTSVSRGHSDDFLDDFSYEGIVGLPATSKERAEYERKESLENDFFGKSDKKDGLSDYYESYHDRSDNREKEEFVKPQKTKHKKHKNRNVARTLIWLMTIAIVVLVMWQNKSQIVDIVKQKVFKESPVISPIESKQTSDYYTGESTNSNLGNSNLNINTNTPTVSPAASTSIDKSAVKVEILNGNGIKNSGAIAKTTLEQAGFVVAKTANAKNFNYATTLIYYKTGKEAAANSVKDALSGKEVTIENNDTLAGEYDVVVVLGAK